MNGKKNKLNLHIASIEDGLYFWDRVNLEKLQKWIVVLMAFFACLPVFVSLTVQLWAYMLRGETGVRLCHYKIVNEYWYSIVYFIGAA